MELSDAFTTDAITAADTNVEGEQEAELRELIRNIYESNEIEGMEAGDQHEDIAVLMFVGGRTFEATQGKYRITMSHELHDRFLEFLNTKE